MKKLIKQSIINEFIRIQPKRIDLKTILDIINSYSCVNLKHNQ